MRGVVFVTGKLGAGKGIYLMHQAKQYYGAGRRVAANFDINSDCLSKNSEEPIFRLPDRPRIEDFEALGRGCPEGEKSNFGCLLLDEAGTWLNCRDYRDKSRSAILDWFIHARKKGWDVFVAVQNESMIDNQIFGATGETIAICSRLDRFRIPVVSDLLEMFFPSRFGPMAEKKKTIMPHLVKVKTYVGMPSRTNKANETIVIKPNDFFNCYDTNYIFTEQLEFRADGLGMWDARAVYNILPGKVLHDWYYKDDGSKANYLGQILTLIFSIVVLFLVWQFGFSGSDKTVAAPSSSVVAPVVVNKFPYNLDGVFITGSVGVRSGQSSQLVYDYVFESIDSAFYPDDVGLKVVSVSRCVAKLIDPYSGTDTLVKCNPYYKRSVPETSDVDVASTDSSSKHSFLSL